MKFLLDTHVLIWWANDANKLSSKVYDLLIDPNHILLLSFVSVWEIQIKSQLGKLKLDLPLSDLITNQQNINNLMMLPIELNHIYSLENLPNHHRDPFDRLLISQAIVENIPILSVDKVFDQYSVERIW